MAKEEEIKTKVTFEDNFWWKFFTGETAPMPTSPESAPELLKEYEEKLAAQNEEKSRRKERNLVPH